MAVIKGGIVVCVMIALCRHVALVLDLFVRHIGATLARASILVLVVRGPCLVIPISRLDMCV